MGKSFTPVHAVLVVWIGVGLLASPKAVGEPASEALPACRAAEAPAEYGELLDVHADTRALIESYRSGWRALCLAPGDGSGSLHELMSQGIEIQHRFSAVFAREEAIRGSMGDTAAWKRARDVHELLSKRYPSFIPAFEGSLTEREYFSPLMDAFRLHRRLGTREDRLFLESGVPIVGSYGVYPWFEHTWDYGGCIRFGEFDWVAELRMLIGLRSRLRGEKYLESVAEYERAMFEALHRGHHICACRRKDRVIEDLSNVVEFLTGWGEYVSQVGRIQTTIDAIQAQEIKVRAEIEQHCSGG